jgi:hypothetical protein
MLCEALIAVQGSVGIDWEENTLEEYEKLTMVTIDASLKLPKDRLLVIKLVKPGTPAASASGLSQWSILRTVNGASVDGVDFDDVIDLLVAERSGDMPLVIDVLERTELAIAASESKKRRKQLSEAVTPQKQAEIRKTALAKKQTHYLATCVFEKEVRSGIDPICYVGMF